MPGAGGPAYGRRYPISRTFGQLASATVLDRIEGQFTGWRSHLQLLAGLALCRIERGQLHL